MKRYLCSTYASAVDFHGYMRAGLNYNAQGGSAYCPGKGASGHVVGRLGAECDTYAELILSQELFNKANNKFTLHTLVAYGTDESNIDRQGNDWQGLGGSGPWGAQRLSLREAYVDYEMPSGMSLWAGKRYYQRKDIHIMDYYYINSSGYGVGLENIGLGNKELGTVSVALRRGATVASGMSGVDENRNNYTFDVRWNGIQMWENASLDLTLMYGWENLSDNQKKGNRNNTGFLAMVEYTQDLFFGGFNKMSVSYGHNGFSRLGSIASGNHEGGYVAPDTRANGWRFIDWGVVEQASWNLGYALLWTHFSPKDKDGVYEGYKGWGPQHSNEFSLVVRPSYKWSDFTSTVLELGYYNRTNFHGWEEGMSHKQHENVNLTKVTIAQQWSPMTHFWSRPSIRVFASLINGSMMDKAITGLSDNHEWVFGAQVEAWW